MSIFPLPIFEDDADPARRDAMSDEEIYARLEAPTSIVVRYGRMKLIGEYPYDGPAKPGCGSKLVARTNRGLEVVEMLTTTCTNSGCNKSVSRHEMLDYIENSGGRDYPFRTDGKILRVASIDDLNRWSRIQDETRARVGDVNAIVRELGLEMKLVELEPILGQEVLTVYFIAEERVDFRQLVGRLASTFGTRVEMRQIGARDEARLVADYERCGQHCCCKNFLKVLKPVSMRSAKVQKATLDPLKISGRCGRLMCCLRYEDETYTDLKARLPRRRARVGTPEGPGVVLDGKILVQLVLVKLEADGREIAVAVEDLCDPDAPLPPKAAPAEDPLRGLAASDVADRTEPGSRARRGRRRKGAQQDGYRDRAASGESESTDSSAGGGSRADAGEKPAAGTDGRKKRRRKRRDSPRAGATEGSGSPGTPGASGESGASRPDASGAADGGPSKKPGKRRRRGRRAGKGPRRAGGGDSSPES